MTKTIVLNNAESCIYGELKAYRDAWDSAINLMESDGELGYIRYGAMVDLYEKQFQTVRAFVSKAWNVSPATIDAVLNGEYKVICEESIKEV